MKSNLFNIRRFLSGKGWLPWAALLLALPLSTVNAQKTVEAEGWGANRAAALESAQRRAVEEAVGIAIGAESMVRNYSLVSDWILSHSFGYVRHYDVIGERKGQDGGTGVTIRAEVSAVMDDLVRDRLAREQLLAWMHKPSVRVKLRETNDGDSLSRTATTTIEEKFHNAGFIVAGIDSGDEALRPDLLILGHADACEGNTPEVMRKAGMVSAQAEIEVELIQADTRTVLASRSARASAPHINPVSAGARALAEAAAPVSDSLLSDVILLWALQRVNTVPIEIQVQKVPYRLRQELLHKILGVEGVRAVYEKEYADSTFSCVVDMEGTSDLLAPRLAGLDIEGRSCSVDSVTWGRVTIRTEAK